LKPLYFESIKVGK
jgi:hypothetical protein